MGRQPDVLITFGIDDSSWNKMEKDTQERLGNIINKLGDETSRTKFPNFTRYLSNIIKEFSKAGDEIDNVAKRFIDKFDYLESIRTKSGNSDIFQFFTPRDLDKVTKDIDTIIEKRKQLDNIKSNDYIKQIKEETKMTMDAINKRYEFTTEKIAEYMTKLNTFKAFNMKGVDVEGKDLQYYASLVDTFQQLNALKVESKSLDDVYKQQSLLTVRSEMEALEQKYLYYTNSGKEKSYLEKALKHEFNIDNVGKTDQYISNVTSAVTEFQKLFSNAIDEDIKKLEGASEKEINKIRNIRLAGFGGEIKDYDNLVEIDEVLQKYIVDIETAKAKIEELNNLTANQPYDKQKENYNELIGYVQRYITLGGKLEDLNLSKTASKIFNNTTDEYLLSLKDQISKLKNVQQVVFGIGGSFGDGSGTGNGTGSGAGNGSGVGGLSPEQLDALTQLLNNIKQSIDDVNNSLTQLGQNDSIKTISESFTSIKDSFDSLKSSLSDNGSFTTAVNGFSEAINKVNEALTKMDNSSQEIERLKTQILELSNAFEQLKVKEEESNIALYQNFQANNQTSSPTNIANTAQEMAASAQQMTENIHEAGNAGQEAGVTITNAEEEIRQKIEETNRAIKNQEDWLKHLKILFSDFRTENKKEANDNLKNATNRFIDYRRNPENYSGISYAEEKINLAWFRAYKEAERQGSGMLSKYETDVTEREVQEITNKLIDAYQFRVKVLNEYRQELATLQQQLAEVSSTPVEPRIDLSHENEVVQQNMDALEKMYERYINLQNKMDRTKESYPLEPEYYGGKNQTFAEFKSGGFFEALSNYYSPEKIKVLSHELEVIFDELKTREKNFLNASSASYFLEEEFSKGSLDTQLSFFDEIAKGSKQGSENLKKLQNEFIDMQAILKDGTTKNIYASTFDLGDNFGIWKNLRTQISSFTHEFVPRDDLQAEVEIQLVNIGEVIDKIVDDITARNRQKFTELFKLDNIKWNGNYGFLGTYEKVTDKEFMYNSTVSDFAMDYLSTIENLAAKKQEQQQSEQSASEAKAKENEATQQSTEATREETKAVEEESTALDTLAKKLEYLRQIRSDAKFMLTAEDKRIDWEEKAYDVGGNRPKSTEDSLNKIRMYEELVERIDTATAALNEFEEKYEKIILTTNTKSGKKIEITSTDDLEGLTLTENKIKDVQFVLRVTEEEIQKAISLLRETDDWAHKNVNAQLYPPVVNFVSTSQEIQDAINKITEYRDKLQSIKDSNVFAELGTGTQDDISISIAYFNTLIETENRILETSKRFEEENAKQKKYNLFQDQDGQLSFIEQTTDALKREEEQANKTRDALSHSQVPGQITIDEYLASKPTQVQQPAQIKVEPILNPEEFAQSVTSQISGVKAEINVTAKGNIGSTVVPTGDIEKSLKKLGSESKTLSNLKTRLETIIRKIGQKTAAFNNEADTVEKVVNKETTQLDKLKTSVDAVTGSIKEKTTTISDQVNIVKSVLSDISKLLTDIKSSSKFSVDINAKQPQINNAVQNMSASQKQDRITRNQIKDKNILKHLDNQLNAYKAIWEAKTKIAIIDEKIRLGTATDLDKQVRANEEAIVKSEKVKFERATDLLKVNNITIQQSRELNNLDDIRTKELEKQKTKVEKISEALQRQSDLAIASSNRNKQSYLNSIGNQLDTLNNTSNVEKYPELYKNTLLEIQSIYDSLKSKSIDLVTQQELDDLQKLINGLKETDKLANQTKVSSLASDIQKFIAKNTKLDGATRNRLQGLLTQLNDPELVKKQLAGIVQEYKNIEQSAYRAGKMGKSFFDIFNTKLVHQIAQQLSFYFSFRALIGYTRRAITAIKELDTALVDLRKTAKMSSSELEGFYKESNKIAKQMGVTTKEIISQAAVWSRLGFSTAEQAEKMATLSSQFAAISPGMDIDTATDGLVSSMKAFGIEVDNVERQIMDNINRIGK